MSDRLEAAYQAAEGVWLHSGTPRVAVDAALAELGKCPTCKGDGTDPNGEFDSGFGDYVDPCSTCEAEGQVPVVLWKGQVLPAHILPNVTWGDKDEWSPTYHPQAIVVRLPEGGDDDS